MGEGPWRASDASDAVRVYVVAPDVVRSWILDQLRTVPDPPWVVLTCPTPAQLLDACNALVVVGLDPTATCDDLASECRGVRGRFPTVRLVAFGPPLAGRAVAAVLDAGADDYVADTTHRMELLARLRVQVRVMSGSSASPVAPEAAFRVNTKQLELEGPLGAVLLTPTEQRLLDYLATAGAASAETLAATLFGRRDQSGRGRDLVYRHIANLRSKLRRVGAEGVLTSTAAGYELRSA